MRGGATAARGARQLGATDLAAPFAPKILPNTVWGTGRVCSGYGRRDGCGTILCRYNPGPLCYICSREARRSEARREAMAG